MTVSREKVNNEATETATITTTRMPWLPSEKKTSSKKHFFASEWKQSISKKKTYKDFVSKLVHSIGTQQGWRSGESTRYPPELDSQTRVICGLSFLVLYSVPIGFSPGTPVSPLLKKTTYDLIRVDIG